MVEASILAARRYFKKALSPNFTGRWSYRCLVVTSLFGFWCFGLVLILRLRKFCSCAVWKILLTCLVWLSACRSMLCPLRELINGLSGFQLSLKCHYDRILLWTLHGHLNNIGYYAHYSCAFGRDTHVVCCDESHEKQHATTVAWETTRSTRNVTRNTHVASSLDTLNAHVTLICVFVGLT